MKKLIATKPIYYKGKTYVPGEEIPGDSAELAEAWKRAGSVKELSEQENEVTEARAEEGTEKMEEETEEKPGEESMEEAAKEPAKKGKRGK